MNASLADYLVPVHADVRPSKCISLSIPISTSTHWAARGVGEIGLAGTAAATGVRCRALPLRLEDLL